MEVCPICDEKYTNVRRKKVVCPNNECDKHSCITCFKKYLMVSEISEPKCMYCEKNISYSFIRKNCNPDFCNKDLHEKKTDIEMKKQMSLLPATQDLATLEREREKYYTELSLYDNRIMELRREINIIDRQKGNVPYPRLIDVKNKDDNKITFIQKCPIEDCTGFLSSSWKCGICENFICSKCLKRKERKEDPSHICDENDVASIKAIKKDSKPCPECGEYIFKIDGCDQMFCIKCTKAFSWKTGRPEEGPIHNPHYFQYMRDLGVVLGRQPGDVIPCEVVPNFVLVNNTLVRWKNYSTENRTKRLELVKKITDIVRVRRHTEFIIIRKYTHNYEEEFTRYRVLFLLKKITEEYMYSRVKKIIKLQEKNTEFLQIYNLFLTISGEILKNIIQMIEEKNTEIEIEKEYEKSVSLVKYCNAELWKLRNSFKNEATMIVLS